ncbi:MAG: chromosome segregation protein SMC [Acidobacteriota bacterium]
MLKLQEIELAGFKSFADRTRIPVPDDLLVVVGPNGSGKSNVTDAVLWALGEQSPKSLRGHKMQDVIFNGSHRRPPAGTAEVLMTFREPGGAKVQVGRRLSRSGESAYLMDGRPVRLKDVHDFLLRHNVSTQGSFLVEQGRVEALLAMSPEERRAIFEEVAGIAHYKENRRSALQKLEATEANLLRLNDILLEVEGQMAVLKKQAAKADRFVKLTEERRARQRRLWGRLYGQWSARRRALERDGELLAAERERREAVVAALEAEGEAARLSLADHERSLQDAVQALHEKDLARERAEQELTRKTDQILSARGRLRQIAHDREELQARIRAGQREVERLEGEVARLQEEERAAAAAAAAAQRELEERGKEAQAAEGEREALRRKAFADAQEHSRLSALLNRLGEDLKRLAERERRLGREEEGLKERESAAASRLEEAEERLRRAREAHGALVEAAREKEARLQEARARSQRAAEALASARRDAAVAERERKVLESHGRNLATSGREAVARRFAGKEPPTLARLLAGAPGELLPALSAVLADLLAGYVGVPWEEAAPILEELRRERGGQAVFFLGGSGEPEEPSGLPPGASLLHRAEGIPEEVRRYLPPVLLVPTPEAAREAAAETGLPAVTPGGLLVHPRGWVRGGAGGPGGGALLEHEHRLEEARRSEEAALRALAAAEEEAREASRVAAEASGAAGEAAEAERKAGAEAAEAERERERAEEERSRLAASRDLLEGEALSAREEKAAFEAQRKELSRDLAASEEERRRSEARLAELEERTAGLRRVLEEAHEAVAESRARHSEVAQRARSAANALGRSRQALEELRATDDRLRGEASLLEERVSALEKAVTEGQQELRALILALEEGRERKARFEEDHRRLAEEAEAAERRAREAREAAQQIREELSRNEVERATAEAEVRNLENRMGEVFEEPPAALAQEFAEEPPLGPEEAEEEGRALVRLDGRIAELGDLNLAARAEYAELEKRHAFLSAQRKDLEEAVASLHETIRKINRTTRERFLEAFHAVGDHFSHLFRQVFEGGEARLSLLDEQNPLDTGVEIYAQPPGKKLQSLGLLSGGEKAMVALSLLFGLFEYRPQPFFLLDEVDAPLDEANIVRFSRLLQQFRGKTQFLVVSHNKRTMELADILYGVTMAEGGVSRVVSVRLQDVDPVLGGNGGRREAAGGAP